jgi:AcrR family transcriptional regulator
MPAARSASPPGSRARARTRALLLDAALRVFARKGAGAAAIHEVAAEAGVSNGTFYNYFRTREELLEAASLALAERLLEENTAASRGVSDPAERLAIGARRFILRALQEATWGAALSRVWASSPLLVGYTAAPLRDDLRAGKRRRRLRYRSEAAAIDLVQGTVLAAMRTVLEGRAGAEHADHAAALLLRALGVDAAEADRIATRPLPAAPPTV